MKAFLLYPGQDFDLQGHQPANAQTLIQDLELGTLFEAMSLGDEFLFGVAKTAVLSSIGDTATIRYRQAILQDCIDNADLVRTMYALSVETLERERKEFFSLFSRGTPGTVLYRSRGVLEMLLAMLAKLKTIAEEHASEFKSEGFTRFFTMLREELDGAFFASAQAHLRQLQLRDGVLISARLGKGNKGTGYVFHKTPARNLGWLGWLLDWLFEGWIARQRPGEYSFYLHPRDEGGARVLSELRDKGVSLVANSLAQSVDHILSFFRMFRTELAFYVGCINLHSQLVRKGEPVCFPEPAAQDERRHSFSGLYDVCLSLNLKERVVGNGMSGDGKDCAIITGANQGGKSVFLRGIGLAQLMMQSGMFVAAETFSANICGGLFTHFKREEDTAMKSGKLDEELERMSTMVDEIKPNAMILFNESFAATNEREGSEIAKQIVSALLEKRIKVFFVTHLYQFAHSLHAQNLENAIFLRAERQSDGKRTFRLVEGGPLETSYGEDLYNKIFLLRPDSIERSACTGMAVPGN
jgi:DNA mismatch repair ATPase MutS